MNGFGMFDGNTENAPRNILANYFLNYGEGLVEMAAQVKYSKVHV